MAAFFYTPVRRLKLCVENAFFLISFQFSATRIGNVSTSFYARYFLFSFPFFARMAIVFVQRADLRKKRGRDFRFACSSKRRRREKGRFVGRWTSILSPLDRAKLETRAFVLSSRLVTLSSAIGFRFHLHLLPLCLLHLLLQRFASLATAEPAASRRLCLVRAVRRVLAAAVRGCSENDETILVY